MANTPIVVTRARADAVNVGRRRTIGLPLATFLVAGNIIGSGVFLLPAAMAAFGSITLLAWLVATAGAVLVALVLGRLGRHSPEAGGACAYAATALGPYMGFQATAVYWVSCLIGNVAIAIAGVGYASHLVPVLAKPAAAALAALGLIWGLTLLNRFGPRLICQLGSGTMIVGIAPILIVALGGWFAFHAKVFLGSWNVTGMPGWRVLPEPVVLAFWAFTGLESASIATAVVERPEKNVARASLLGVLLAAAIYIGACGAIMGVIPAHELALSQAPFADAVARVLGTAAGGIIALLAVIKVTGTLGSFIFVTAETAQAGAEKGLFPRLFARRDHAGRPTANLMIAALIMSAAVGLSVSPTLAQQYARLVEASTVLCLLLYIYACLAVWPYSAAAPNDFRGYRKVAAAGLLLCAGVIAGASAGALAVTAVVVAATYPAYRWIRT